MINGRLSEWSVTCSVIPSLLSLATGLTPGWELEVGATEAGTPLPYLDCTNRGQWEAEPLLGAL